MDSTPQGRRPETPSSSPSRRAAIALAIVALVVLIAVIVLLPGGLAGRLGMAAFPAAGTTSGARPTTARAPSLEALATAEPAAPAVTYSQRQQSSVFQPDPKTLGEGFVRAAEEELDRAGADPSDTRAAAEELGFDAQRVFEFLRDEIRIEPYLGVLRGARGTLAARAGNALDRALLGQALLKASGLDSRLVAGTLPADRAEQVLVRFLAADATRGPLASCALETDEAARVSAARDLASKTGLAADRVARLLNQASTRAEAFWTRANEQRSAHFAFLAGQLQRSGIVSPGDGEAVRAQLRQRLERHYWLQVSDDGETWSDFDPSLPDARRGTAYGTRPAVLEEPPEDGFHRFQIDLVYHTTSEGAPAEETLLSGTFASADVLFEPLEFRIQPAEVTPTADELAAMSAGQRIDTLRKYKRFQGLLRAGSEVRNGRVFDLDGRTYNPRDSARGASIGGLFGRAFGAEEEKETAAEFRELQVVLRLTSPGREPFTQTRTLVRAADLRASTFVPPLLEWEILVQPQWLSADLAGFQLLQYLMSVRASIAAAVKSGAASARSAQDAPPPYPQQLVQFALLRQRATAAVLAELPAVTGFIDEPLLTIAGHRLLALREAEGLISAERTIDIVSNAVRFVGRDRSSRPAAFDAALQQGAADATLEHRFLAETFPESTVSSGVTVLQQSQHEQRPVVAVAASEPDKLRRAGLPETDVDWIRANEPADARLLVATAAAPPAAWWSVRPDGTSVLRVSGGRGQGTIEHQTDVMLVALKVQFGLICSYESVHALAGEGTVEDRWKFMFCTLANAASVGFLAAHAHVASWILIAIETVEFASSGLWEE